MRHTPILGLAAAFALAACGAHDKQPAANSSESPSGSVSASANASESRAGLKLESGRLLLPALKGSPGAAYFMLDNSRGATVVLTAIGIDGAGKADMHQTADDKMTSVERVEIAKLLGLVRLGNRSNLSHSGPS